MPKQNTVSMQCPLGLPCGARSVNNNCRVVSSSRSIAEIIIEALHLLIHIAGTRQRPIDSKNVLEIGQLCTHRQHLLGMCTVGNHNFGAAISQTVMNGIVAKQSK